MTDPVKIGFLEDIKDVHFGSVFCLVWCEKLRAFGGAVTPSTRLDVTSPTGLHLPARAIIQGSPQIAPGLGAPPGSVPVTDTITSQMRTAYTSWIGTNVLFPDVGNSDQLGYLIVKISGKNSVTLSLSLTGNNNGGGSPFIVGVATYKEMKSVAFAARHAPLFEAGINVVTPKGTDFFGDQFADPTLAASFQRRQVDAANDTHNFHVSVDGTSLAISMSA